jgi:hypothetical protein
MTNKLLLILAAFSMTAAACTKPDINTPTKIEYKVVMPESKYFTCDVVKLPNPKDLTDAQVAQLINDLVKANRICKNNMDGIKTYLEAAQKILEERVD